MVCLLKRCEIFMFMWR